MKKIYNLLILASLFIQESHPAIKRRTSQQTPQEQEEFIDESEQPPEDYQDPEITSENSEDQNGEDYSEEAPAPLIAELHKEQLPFIKAVYNLEVDAIKNQLKQDPRVLNIPAKYSGKTPLMIAVTRAAQGDKKALEIVKLLLSYKPDLNLENDRRTAINYVFPDRGLQEFHKDYKEDTALELIKLLHQAGAQLSQGASYGGTQLMDAAYFNSPRVIDYLIKQGVDINKQDLNGYTALMYAGARAGSEVISQLLKAGASPTITGRDGLNAYKVAEGYHNEDGIRLLKKYEKP